MNEAERLVELIPRLRRDARALVGEKAGADDLVQDTLERAWAKLHLYRRGTDLRAWLFTVMHNVHVNRVRSARPTDPLDDEITELAQRPTQPPASLARATSCPPCCSARRRLSSRWSSERRIPGHGSRPAGLRRRAIAGSA